MNWQISLLISAEDKHHQKWNQGTLQHLQRRETQLARCLLRYSWAWDWKALVGFQTLSTRLLYFFKLFSPNWISQLKVGVRILRLGSKWLFMDIWITFYTWEIRPSREWNGLVWCLCGSPLLLCPWSHSRGTWEVLNGEKTFRAGAASSSEGFP